MKTQHTLNHFIHARFTPLLALTVALFILALSLASGRVQAERGTDLPGSGKSAAPVAAKASAAPVAAAMFATFTVTKTADNNGGPANLTVTAASLLEQVKAVRNDFDGDGKSDLAQWRSNLGEWQVKFSSGGELHRIALVEPTGKKDADEYVPVAADFDGDGKTDAAVWRARDGRWLIKYSLSGELVKAHYGLPGDVPMLADYDGDGRADLAVWRNGDGLHIQRSSDQTEQALYLGKSGDVPVIGDFDGDGLMDVAVFRAGHWLLRDAATGMLSDVTFGQAGDTPMAADIDGDGKDDLILGRASTGYVRRSTDQTVEAAPWGRLQASKTVAFGDYDGDGKAEPAIWRVAKAAWDVLFNQTPR